jgi:hypothetical protein
LAEKSRKLTVTPDLGVNILQLGERKEAAPLVVSEHRHADRLTRGEKKLESPTEREEKERRKERGETRQGFHVVSGFSYVSEKLDFIKRL